jgi:hypothetical protein
VPNAKAIAFGDGRQKIKRKDGPSAASMANGLKNKEES